MHVWLWAVVAGATVLAGCVGYPEPLDQASELSFLEALGQARAATPPDAVLGRAEAHAVPMDDDRVPSGLADSWRFTFTEPEDSLAYDVVVSSLGTEVGPARLAEELGACPNVPLDSTEIAAALGESPHWERVWEVAAGDGPMGPGWGDPDVVQMQLECRLAAGWHVTTPFLRNDDDTVSVRLFLVSPDGVLAAFDDTRGGSVHWDEHGLGVNARRIMSLDILVGPGTATASFQADGAPRFALLFEPDGYQVLGMPLASGTITVTDPEGTVTSVPLSTGSGLRASAWMVFEPGPDAVFGTWTIQADVGPPWILGDVDVTRCTGVPTATFAAQELACLPLAG